MLLIHTAARGFAMILHILMTVILSGLALMLSVLHLMRALYASGICEPPACDAENWQAR